MDSTIQEIEQELLKEPFNSDLRFRYASALSGQEDYSKCLEQVNLLIKQDSSNSKYYLLAAKCANKLGNDNERLSFIERARNCGNFNPEELESSDDNPQRAIPLQVLGGGRHSDQKVADVISISSTDTVRFSDVVGMKDLKKIIRLRIIEPFLRPGLFERFKKKVGGGVLLYGPPGCGKTMIARAIATECDATFTSIGISDILNMWVGESERNLAAIFEKARAEAPSVLFFDELDALAYSRSKANSDHTRFLVNEFLSQLDGMSGKNDRVMILGATNMPWDVDDAMKRPGRFDRQIFVPPPDLEARAEMLKIKLIGVPTERFDARIVASKCEFFSGADIDGLIDGAKDEALHDILTEGTDRAITEGDLINAAQTLEPSTLDWLKTAKNLVKFGGGSRKYKEMEKYLRSVNLY